MIFGLLYHQHGGSGLNITYSEVLELDLDNIDEFLERLGEARRKEAAAIEHASKKK
jgi:hypothetical protein